MNCEEALLAISAALDGELAPEARVKLSRHLLSCPECRALAEDLRVLTDVLEDSDREVPAGLAARIQAAVAAEVNNAASSSKKKRRAPYLRTVAAMLAACVCLGGVGLFLSWGSGMKSDSNMAASGGAAAPFEAAPEYMGKSATDDLSDSENGGRDFDETAAEGEPEAACVGGAVGPSADAEAPMPMPSAAPAPPQNAEDVQASKNTMSDSAERAPAAGEADPQESVLMQATAGVLTQAEAEELARAFYFERRKGEDAEDCVFFCLGLSPNGDYYLFEVRRGEDGETLATLAVPLHGGAVIDRQDDGYEQAAGQ